MNEKHIMLDERSVPLDSVLYALEQTTDYLRADYASGVIWCDPVGECFASVFETLVRDILENDAIPEDSRKTFSERLKSALAQHFSATNET